MAKRNWSRAAVLIGLLLPAFVLACFHLDLPSLGVYHDDGIYLVTGKAIADGKAYRLESLPDEGWQTKYPPVFPLALAAVWKLAPRFPANLPGFLIVAWLAVPALLVVFLRTLGRLGFSTAEQVVACLGVLVYPDVLPFSVSLMADLWFTCAVLLVLLLAERAGEEGNWRLAAAAGVVAGLAYLTKSSGLVLLASVPGVLLLRRRWRPALAFCLVFAPVIAAWSGWAALHARPITDYNDIFYSSYLREFLHNTVPSELLARLPHRLDEYLQRLGGAFVPASLAPNGLNWLRRLVSVIGIAGVVGLVRAGRARQYAAFAALYAIEMCVWPSALFSRYVLPVFPLWMAGFVAIFRSLGERESAQSVSRFLQPLTTGVLVFLYLLQTLTGIRGATVFREQRRQLEPAYEWIARNVPADVSLTAFRDPVVYLYTGRHTEGVHASTAGSATGEAISRRLNLGEFCRRRGHAYLLLSPRDPEYSDRPTRTEISAALQKDPEVRLVYSADKVAIYRVSATAVSTLR